jgi:hypothetical protein
MPDPSPFADLLAFVPEQATIFVSFGERPE